jgi:ATP-binding cassette subfamily B protein
MYKFLIRKKALITMNYTLNKPEIIKIKEDSLFETVQKLKPLLKEEKKQLIQGLCLIITSSLLNLLSPVIIGHTIDTYIQNKDFHGVLKAGSWLLIIYCIALLTSYFQTKIMGGVGQRTIFNLRNKLFLRLQDLPIDFFNQNKAGDLISRINNDTSKLNQFFSQSLMQFVGNIFIMFGAGIFILIINFPLGLIAVIPAFFILIFNRFYSPYVRRKNAASLKSTGSLSSEIQESLNNFKVIVAFNRRDYFRERFNSVNQDNYKKALSTGIAGSIFTPLYTFAYNVAQISVLYYGIYLISEGNFSIGLLISFLAYTNRFYDPIRQIAAIWPSFQMAVAGWERISEILSLESNLPVCNHQNISKNNYAMEFKDVSFGYTPEKMVLKHISFCLERGKTYALVGPTGGGKTTTANLMVRLYDPTEGSVFIDGKDIKSITEEERAGKIGFILQEPFLFSGTVRENILYGNKEYQDYSNEQLAELILGANFDELLEKFDKGLDTEISINSDSISLGQKQIIAFIRAVLRHPEIIILDEATANIDTVTEQLLENILRKLPRQTIKVIIAHRLNTISSADKIFFVNSGEINLANSLQEAVEMLSTKKRES